MIIFQRYYPIGVLLSKHFLFIEAITHGQIICTREWVLSASVHYHYQNPWYRIYGYEEFLALPLTNHGKLLTRHQKELAVHGYTLKGLKEWPDKYQIHTDLRNVQLTNIDNIII